jgi:zinc protease
MMDRAQQPNIEELSEIKLLPVERTVLPNGIPLMIINSEEQSVTRIDLMFGGGYWTQEQKLQAFLTNAMLREGTASYTSAELAEKFDFYGSTLELSLFPQYSYVTSYCLNKYFERTAELLYSMITEATFPEKEFDIMLNRELQKYQINSTQAKFITMRNLRNALYGDQHPMGRKTTEEDFKKLHTDMLRRLFRSCITTQPTATSFFRERLPIASSHRLKRYLVLFPSAQRNRKLHFLLTR